MIKLKGIFSKFKDKPKKEKETFLALEINTETVKSSLWTVDNKKTKILKVGSIEDWDGKNKKLLLASADRTISNASEGAEIEPKGVIFGLSQDWVAGDNIKSEKKELLKYLCEKLELKPLGFVVILESLLAYLKIKEGTPISAIMVNVLETENLISLVQLGKIIGTKRVGKSDDLAADVHEGLARFGKLENLPARMVLFNSSGDFEEYKQQLVSYDWQGELPFLHFPKVESLSAQATIKAVSIAGGAEVAKSLGFEIKKQEKELGTRNLEHGDKKAEESKDHQIPQKPETSKAPETSKEELMSAKEFGFVEGEDVEEKKIEHRTQNLEHGKEKSKTAQMREGPKEELKPKGEVKIKERTPLRPGMIPGLRGAGRKFFGVVKKIFRPNKAKLAIIIGLLLLLGLAGGVFVFYWYVPKAEVTIYLEPKNLEKEMEIIVDPSVDSVNVEQGILPGEINEVEVQGEKNSQTTGTKTVGERASGKITIYNKTDLQKSFSTGTTLIGPGDLLFSLSEDVSIASRSAQEEGISFGKAEAQISANAIGTEGNLSSGEKLSFLEYPDSLYSATVENGLSGGTSREISVVAQEDLTSLQEDLEEELMKKAEEKIEEQMGDNKKIIKDSLSGQVMDEDFSAETGEETNSLSLNLKMKYSAFGYDENNLERFILTSVKDAVPDGFIYDPQEAEIEAEEIELVEDRAEMKAVVKAGLVPKIDFEEVKENIKGRYPQKVDDYLRSLANFKRADIKVKPNLPNRLKTLPRKSKNIIIETEIEK